MEKRSTRGKRVTELAGEDANFDQEFWNSDIWQEAESGDDSFSEEEVQPDVFDSDFNDTEDDDEDDDEGEEEDRQLKKQSRGENKKSSNKYKDPSALGKSKTSSSREMQGDDFDANSVPRERSITKKRSREEIDRNILDISKERNVRKSTKEKSADAEASLLEAEKQAKLRPKPRPAIKHQYNQDELLREALDTEISNIKWIETQKILAAELGEGEGGEKKSKNKSQTSEKGDFIRILSRRGTPKTITFSNIDIMPSFLQYGSRLEDLDVPDPKDRICCITGQKAKYRDPVTQLPYATMDAYQEIKKRYHLGR